MAGKRRRPNGWEYVIKRAGVLEKPIYVTFENEDEGDAYVARVEALLDRGIVPAEHTATSTVLSLEQLISRYIRDAKPSAKDEAALGTIIPKRGKAALTGINVDWVDAWISEMKRIDNIAPATIRAKVGALARCTDWGMRKKLLTMPDHPLRTLPEGYAQYTDEDGRMAEGGAREDTERDRRLEPGADGQDDEHTRILAVIEAGALPRKQRPLTLPDKAALRFIYILALESAMRLREMYTLTVDQVDTKRRTIFLDKTKNGTKRQVPLSTVALAELKAYLEVRAIPKTHDQRLLFPWWDGNRDRKALRNMTDYIGSLFHNNRDPGIFDAAGCLGLNFHDLRHEATSRLFERTQLSDAEIMKITGHKSQKMLLRYANIRASTLADKLW